MKRVLITGASGLLGSSLSPYLKTCGYEVFTHSRKSATNVIGDLSNEDDLNSILDIIQPGIIINLAASTNVDECESHPIMAYYGNIRIVENIVSYIKNKSPTTYLIQMSTDQLYDGLGPHKESNINLKNNYAFSKYMGEAFVSSVNSIVLRTNFFGKSRSISKKSFSDWVIDSVLNQKHITVYEDILFSPLHIETICFLINIVIEKRKRGVYNLGSKDGMSKSDFSYSLVRNLNLSDAFLIKGKSDDSIRKAYRPKDMRMDSSYFESVFNFNLPTLEMEIQKVKI